ncbi:hypothetical protein IW136_000107 [Coemansia sp. RSA 678]|nr:hypothetical protein IW136_000107 [Coemansia sp. RSA 678]
MQIKDSILAILGIVANVVVAAPVGEENQIRNGNMLVNPKGDGAANADLVLGGGILPTLTLGAALAGGNDMIGIGASQTLGIGGGVLPTAFVGGGFGLGLGGNNIILQNSGSFSEGGYLNGLIPTFHASVILNNQIGYSSSNGDNIVVGGNGGGVANLEYGGNFIPKSTLDFTLGAGFAGSIHNGPVPTKQAKSAELTPSGFPVPSPSPTSSHGSA